MDVDKMTDQELIDWILMVFTRDGGPYAGELVFEFMRAVHAKDFRLAREDFSADYRDLMNAFALVEWHATPQGSVYWERQFANI